jgi:hypothetical protein
MSENLTLYDVGNDDDGVDERTSVHNLWNIILPDGTFQSWQGEEFNYDHLDNPDTSPFPPLIPDSNETHAEMYQNLPDPPFSSFCTFYDPKSKTYSRKDGYQISEGQDLKTVIMALHLSMVPQTHTVSDASGAQHTFPINTLFITPRLVFPIKGETPSQNDWADSKKRDEAATSIDGSFWHLYSKGTLTAAIAGVSPNTGNTMADENGNHLRILISTLMRDPKFNKTPDGRPGPTFHSVNRVVSDLAAVTLADGSISPLTIRLTGSVMGHPTGWANETVFPKGDKATDGEKNLKLSTEQIKVLEKNIGRYRQDHKHPPKIDRCVLGNVELWGPERTRPDASIVASSSTAAS